jgi:redox-sensitive bicupin YhaK (pirin superfamily)
MDDRRRRHQPSAEPSRAMREKGGRVHGFQIWINLPALLEMTRPRSQEAAIDQAGQDYRSGPMGEITRTAEVASPR